MDALAIIDRGTQTAAPTTTKAKNKNEQQFSHALNKEQQAQKQPENKPVNKQADGAEAPQKKQAVAHDAKTETQQNVDNRNVDTAEAGDKTTQKTEMTAGTQQQAKVRDIITDLMKTLSQDESIAAEDREEIKALLSDLLQQLESTDGQGEQVFAGIDLSKFAAKLESLDNDTDQEELLAHLVAQIENQLTDQLELQQDTELAVAVAVTESAQQNPTPTVVENQAQARRALQKAFDAVASQQPMSDDNVATEENISALEPSSEDAALESDPRFAGLLKPRPDQPSQQLRSENEQRPVQQAKPVTELKQSETATPVTETTQETGTTPPSGGKQILENFVQQTQHNLQAQGQQQTQGSDINRTMPQTQTVQLASGRQVADSQIFDQVVTHLSGSVNGDTGRMVLRLQPAELGSLRLELTVEGDRIQANLHAQSHQVQEVLERNLPQLRNALAEQGLKIDQFQVNVDQRQQSGQFENMAQQHQNDGSQEQSGWQQQNAETEEQAIPLAHLMQNGGGGISLHV